MIELNQILENQVTLNPYKFPAIYFLICKNKIIYIGSTSNLNNRLLAHRKNKRMRFDSISYIRFESDQNREMRALECSYIDKFKPKFNIEFNPDCNNLRNVLFQKYIQDYDSLVSFSKAIGISTTTLNKFFAYNSTECDNYTDRISLFLFPDGIKENGNSFGRGEWLGIRKKKREH